MFNRNDIHAAADAGIFSAEQAARFDAWLAERHADTVRFTPAHILYYFGGLVAIGAISLFVTLAWESWKGLPMLLLACGFAALGLLLAHKALSRGLRIPAGILVTFAVCTTPLAVYSLQAMLGFWEGPRHYDVTDFHRYIDWRWFFMEMATLLTAAIALYRYRMPFLLMPVAIIFWYLSMDLVPLLFQELDYQWELRRLTSLWMGIGVILLAFWVDVRTSRREDFAFWLYLFGVLMFWGGLSTLSSDSELNKFIYCMINVAMLAIGAMLMRRVFAVFGALGIAGYLGHLSRVFDNSLLFPVALAAIGLGIIYAGVQWQRHERELHQALLGLMPQVVQKLIRQAHGQH
jgi:hypothetical protein